MMHSDMVVRLKTAGEYQRKAIRALFPEEMGGHLDVIEKEVKLMAAELLADLVKGKNDGACREEKSPKAGCKAQKIDIE